MRALVRSLVAIVALTSAAAAQTTPSKAKPANKADDPINAEGYIRPPAAVAKLVDAPRESNFTWGAPSPTRKYLLHALVQPQNLESMGKKHYNLGGWQVDPMGNRARAMTSRSTTGYELLDWATNKVIKIELPPNARGSTFSNWSPDGGTFAYYAQFPDATHIYLANPATGKSTPLTKVSVVATNVQNFEWTADGKSVVAVLVPDGRGPEPKEPPVADGIRVRINENNTLKTRNYPDLLDGPYEKTLFSYYNMGQLSIIDVKTRNVTKVGAPGMITRIDPSPDAKYFRVTYIDEPFSYILPVSSFGTHEVIIDGTGKVLKEMAKRPLREGTASDIVDPNDPNGGAAAGGFGGRGGGAEPDTTRRGLSWHPFESGLMFMRSAIEDSTVHADSVAAAKAAASTRGNGRAGAGGGARGGRGGGGGGGRAGGRGGRAGGAGAAGAADSTAGRPDTLFLWQAPFVGDNKAILKPLYVTPGRGTINGVQFSNNGRIMFVNETVNGATSTDAIFLDENNAKFTVTQGGGGAGAPAGRGGAGGRGGRGGGGGGASVGLLTEQGSRGQAVVMQSSDGKFVYAAGTADSAGGAAPAGRAGGGRGGRGGRGGMNAIEKIEIKTGARTQVYESTITDMTEGAVTPLNPDFTKVVVTRQTSQLPAESFLIDVASKNATQLTTSKNYWPEITTAIHKTVFARRADGINLRIRVTLPPDWKPGTRLPALFWFYPAEFDSDSAYKASLTGGRGGAGAPAAD